MLLGRAKFSVDKETVWTVCLHPFCLQRGASATLVSWLRPPLIPSYLLSTLQQLDGVLVHHLRPKKGKVWAPRTPAVADICQHTFYGVVHTVQSTPHIAANVS